MGWTPGISNVLARKGADQLDEIDEIAIAWGGSASDSEGYAVILHVIHIFTGFVPSYQNGRWKQVEAGSGREKTTFPLPVGDVLVYHLGHPEPVTIPRYIPARTVTLKGGLSEEELNRLATLLARLKLTKTEARKDRIGKAIKALLPVLSRIGKPERPCSAVRVEVTGTKDGERRHIIYSAADHMGNLTGIPLAIGTGMVGRGEVKVKGVVAPEGCIDPDIFIEELGKRNVKVYEGSEFDKELN